MSDPIRVALIGCGAIALAGHMPALVGHDGFELRVVCDRDRQRAETLAQASGVGPRIEQDAMAAIEAEDVDACVLALHPEVSVGLALACIAHGKPVLDEKPMARSLADGQRIVDAVAAGGQACIYQVGFCFRYGQLIRELTQWHAQLGGPCHYEVAIYDEQLNADDAIHLAMIRSILANSSAITHEGSHVVDWLSLLNPAPITRAFAQASMTLPDLPGPNLWSAQLGLGDGSVVDLKIGWLLPNLPTCTFQAMGPEGFLNVDLRTGQGVCGTAGGRQTVTSQPLEQAWAAQLDVFAEAIRTGRVVQATAADGWRALRATLACEQSDAHGEAVVLA